MTDGAVSALSRSTVRWRRTASLKRKPVSSSFKASLSAFDVDADVVSLGKLLDRVGQLTAAPIFQSDHLATGIGDEGLVAFQHGRNLFALIRVNQEHDLVVTHRISLWVPPRPGGLDRGSRFEFEGSKRQGKAREYSRSGPRARASGAARDAYIAHGAQLLFWPDLPATGGRMRHSSTRLVTRSLNQGIAEAGMAITLFVEGLLARRPTRPKWRRRHDCRRPIRTGPIR